LAFAERKTKKQYLAVLRGHLDMSKWPVESDRKECGVVDEKNGDDDDEVCGSGSVSGTDNDNDNNDSNNGKNSTKMNDNNKSNDDDINSNSENIKNNTSNIDDNTKTKSIPWVKIKKDNVQDLSWQRQSMITNLKIHHDLFLELYTSESKKNEDNEKDLLCEKMTYNGDLNCGSIADNDQTKNIDDVDNILTDKLDQINDINNIANKQITDEKSKLQIGKMKYNKKNKKIKVDNNAIPYRTESLPLFEQLKILSTYNFRDFELRPKLRKLLRKALKVIFTETKFHGFYF
jgi:hypothetical protein